MKSAYFRYRLLSTIIVRIPKNITVLAPWEALSASTDGESRATALSERLKHDLPEGHALDGLDLEAVAVRRDQDDVLFMVSGGSHPLAVVHMTWRRETNPAWPRTRLFSDWDEWEQSMRGDHQDYS